MFENDEIIHQMRALRFHDLYKLRSVVGLPGRGPWLGWGSVEWIQIGVKT